MAIFVHMIYFVCLRFFTHQLQHVARGFSEMHVFSVFRVFATANCAFFLFLFGWFQFKKLWVVCVCLGEFFFPQRTRGFDSNPRIRAAEACDTEGFFSHVKSFKEPRAVFVQTQEVVWFMSQGKFHFVPNVGYHERVEPCKRTSTASHHERVEHCKRTSTT